MTIECKLQRNIHAYLQTHIHSDKEREKRIKNNSNTIAQANEVANTTRKKMHKENNEKLTTIHS